MCGEIRTLETDFWFCLLKNSKIGQLTDVHYKIETLLLENGFDQLCFIPGNAGYV